MTSLFREACSLKPLDPAAVEAARQDRGSARDTVMLVVRVV